MGSTACDRQRPLWPAGAAVAATAADPAHKPDLLASVANCQKGVLDYYAKSLPPYPPEAAIAQWQLFQISARMLEDGILV